MTMDQDKTHSFGEKYDFVYEKNSLSDIEFITDENRVKEKYCQLLKNCSDKKINKLY